MNTFRPSRRRGTSLAELPITLWVFIFFMLLPLIDFATLGYRAVLAYSGVRDATTKAALQASFTLAKSTATSQLGVESSAWTGIGYSGTSTYAVEVDATGNEVEEAADTPWSRPINTANVYLIRVKTNATCNPIINMAPSGTWNAVPGLTGPITLQFTYQVAAEHPEGLVK